MSALQTDFDGEYRFVDGKTRLNAEELNRRFLSLHQRLNGVEVKGEGYDGLIAQGIGVALQRINEGVAPLLATLLTEIEATETALDLLLAQVAGGISGSAVKVTPPAGFASTDLQAALIETLQRVEVNRASTARNSNINARDLYLSGF